MIREIYILLVEFVRTFGGLTLFFIELLQQAPRTLALRFRLVVAQVYNAGALSLVIIMICGGFVGGVLALQGYANLTRFGAEDAVGVFAGFALIKATDQLSAMEMMAVDPIRRVVVPRFLGGVIAMPFLVAIFSCVGLLGAHLVGVNMLGIDVGAFWQQMQNSLDLRDVTEGILKSIVFGFIASLMAVWEGFNSIPTAEGVSRATTRTVVITAIAVLITDFMITAAFLRN